MIIRKRLVMVNPFSVKKIKELNNSPKKTVQRKTIAKLAVWEIFNPRSEKETIAEA